MGIYVNMNMHFELSSFWGAGQWLSLKSWSELLNDGLPYSLTNQNFLKRFYLVGKGYLEF